MKHFILITALFISSLASYAQTQIIFYTTMGEFTVEMSDSLTPITSGNFIDLTEQGYYDGVIFHRVIDNFMIQGGDPTGTGSGGPGYTIEDEFDSTGTLSNIQKTISMANTGAPNSGGSQFFINLVNNTYLDFDKPPLTSKHPVFGMVIEGFNIVQDIGNVAVNAQNRPLTDVVMDSLRIVRTDTVDTIPPPEPEGIATSDQDNFRTKVFPNPIGNQSIITIESPTQCYATISVLDINGRILSQFNHQLRNGMNRIDSPFISSDMLSAGVYTILIKSDSYSSRTKFVSTGQ
jgi:cyclophilin family peptidyl-prolyl cis-trans isomerase